VVARAGEMLDAEELRARLKSDLSAYKVPRYLWICTKADLPFLDSGKIKKQALAERITGRYGGD
ncbi:MAG: long-chain fatty acid--CoA ligase, partial [Deltaproteobacteria bacterium]|nr:long-chain fatty acid--CoA ligase [Deltaproteobacteria bacterium]